MLITVSSADKMHTTDTHSSFHWTYRPSHGQRLNRCRLVDCIVNLTVDYNDGGAQELIVPLEHLESALRKIDELTHTFTLATLANFSSKYFIHIDGLGISNSYESFSQTGGIDVSDKVGTTDTAVGQPTLKIDRPTSEIWKIDLVKATNSAYTTATKIDSLIFTLEMWYEPEPSDALYKDGKFKIHI